MVLEGILFAVLPIDFLPDRTNTEEVVSKGILVGTKGGRASRRLNEED